MIWTGERYLFDIFLQEEKRGRDGWMDGYEERGVVGWLGLVKGV